MAMVYDDNSGNYVWQDEPDANWGAAPAQPAAPALQNGSFGVPINGGNPAGYQDLSYWQSRHDEGLPGSPGVNDIFDANGQMMPGWARTGNGYERVGASSPAPSTGGDYHLPGDGSYSSFRGGNGGGGGYDPSGFAWPQWNAPQYQRGPAMQAPPPFSYEAFKAPDFNDIYNDGSFKGRRDEGLQAIEHGAAAKGLTRLPATLKALAGWNQDFASREYGNIFDRSANTYSMNRNNAADNYSTNYGISRDVWDRNETANLNAYDRDYGRSRDMFDVNEFQPAKMSFDDMYRRYKAELDATVGLANGGYD